MTRRSTQAGSPENIVSVTEKVKFLRQPTSYPYKTTSVEVKETHMSWVFLVDGWVYKLKKPVKYPFLDLTSVEARLQNAKTEVRLNKRFARGIYKGVVPLTIDTNSRLAINGDGNITDWLVLMKRIPEEDMLDYAIIHQNVQQKQLIKAATLIAKYYKKADAVTVDRQKYRERLRQEIATAYTGLNNPLFNLNLSLIKKLAQGMLCFLKDHEAVFDQRVNSKKIIEVHGDLKPEHIRLTPRIAIIDRLEFSRDLRIQDVAEEIAYLSMECEILDNADAGKVFLEIYSNLTNDRIPKSLITFFKLKRAFNRAFLVARHLLEPSYKNDPKWTRKAEQYLKGAEKYYLLLGHCPDN